MNETATTTLDVEVKIKTRTATGELADTIAAGAKLTKADAGRSGTDISDATNLTIESFETGLGFDFPKVEIEMGYKLTKADAGVTA